MWKHIAGTKMEPDFYACGNCKRDLKVSEYRTRQTPDVESEEDDVHIHYSPNYYPFTLMCTCGHYTVVTDVRQNKRQNDE